MKFKSFLIAALLSVGFGSQASAYEYETVKGDPMQTRIYTLPNGLKVYLSVNKEQPRIQTYVAVRTGSRNDPAETTGLAHYLIQAIYAQVHSNVSLADIELGTLIQSKHLKKYNIP